MKLQRGINLGGFLSQCVHEQGHYETFVVEKDIEQIALWGFDHVRLPVDYEVLEEEDGTTKQQGFALVRKVIDWSKQYELDIVLDLHKAYGYDFNDAGDEKKNTLFTDPVVSKRFVDLWRKLAVAFAEYDHVAFELLNEVVEQENAQLWNDLIHETVSAIRAITRKVPIIYGGIQWNSVKTLKLLDIPKKEDNIIFTFHFYEPLLFTHQKADWVETIDKEKEIFYPESMEYYRKESIPLGYQGEVVTKAQAQTMGTEFIHEMVSEAILAAKKAGVALYCGEFGVIDAAPIEDTMRWFADVDEVFRKYEIGCAVWSYKEMDFGFTGAHYDEIREELLKLWIKQ